MKKIAYFLAVLFCIPLMSMSVKDGDTNKIADADADLILGNWRPSNGRSVIKMYKGVEENGEDPDKYYGKIVWLSETKDEDGNIRKDVNNPDESLRDRTIKGLVIVKDMEMVEVEGKTVRWGGGTIYDPNNGSEYSFEAELSKKKEDILNGRGFIGVSLFGRTDTWRRLVKK